MGQFLATPSGAAIRGDAPGLSRRSDPSPRHILLVDDDEAFRYAAAKVLCNAGFVVSRAPDHRLALQILEGPQPPDLLITDLVMPRGIHGFALARMARLRCLKLRVLYLTAYDLPTEEAIGKVLYKPISLDALAAEARDALAGPSDPAS